MLGREVAEGEDAEQVVGGGEVEHRLDLLQRGARRADDQRLGRVRVEWIRFVDVGPAVLAREMVDVARPGGVGLDAQALCFFFRLGYW